MAEKRNFLLVISVLCLVFGCATIQPPAMQQFEFSGQSSSQLFNRVVQKITMAGLYEIKSKDEASGIIQIFRPMTGMFSRPGYGHKIIVTIENGNITVKAFPMEGVTGGETPEEIKNEVINTIKQ